ncbi:cytochrome b [uncultured Methylobacterium sp.]|uniref:cytochrome b n=1 Tax=uncultured Methylobacterium sp. TaxID=157278 RepID=UPI0035CA94E0
MMAAGYLSLAVVLAVTLNHANRWLRAAGTAVVALGLAMIVLSILLADFDGTFAARTDAAAPLDRIKPFVLNAQALVAGAAVPFLLWAAWKQMRRTASAPPLRNGAARFGLLSRYAHWITATLMLCSLPMGLFLSVLPGGSPERADFLAAHQSMGLTLVIVVVLRIAVLLTTPAPGLPQALQPWERRVARTLHGLLYGLIVAFPVSGLLMSAYQGEDVWFYGWHLPQVVTPDVNRVATWAAMHGWLLPALFYAAILAHVGAVIKRHFADERFQDVRRMIT